MESCETESIGCFDVGCGFTDLPLRRILGFLLLGLLWGFEGGGVYFGWVR